MRCSEAYESHGNNSLIRNLYLSIMELNNESQKDYENVVVKVFTNDTDLLSERSELVGSTRVPSQAHS